MTLDAIKQAIGGLPEGDRASLVASLNDEDATAWDEQIEAEFPEGGAGGLA